MFMKEDIIKSAKRHASRNHAWNMNRRRIKLCVYNYKCVYTYAHVIIHIYDICLQPMYLAYNKKFGVKTIMPKYNF